MSITRRNFIGSSLMAVPLVRAFAGMMPLILECEWVLAFQHCGDEASIAIRRYVNGSVTVEHLGKLCEHDEIDGWLHFYNDTMDASFRIYESDLQLQWVSFVYPENLWLMKNKLKGHNVTPTQTTQG